MNRARSSSRSGSTPGVRYSIATDHRSTAGYRRKLAGNLFAKFVAEKCTP